MRETMSRSVLRNVSLLAALVFVLASCSSGGGGSSGPSGTRFGLMNLEINHPNPAIQVSQIYLDGSTTTPGPFPCQVTSPIASPAVFTCNSAVYDPVWEELTISATIEGVNSEIFIDLYFPPDIYVEVSELEDNFEFWEGGGRFVDTELFARSHMNSSGDQSTTFVLINPEPGYTTATLSGPGLPAPVELWNSDYADVYRTYLQFSLTDYIPQLTGAFVSYSSYDAGVMTSDQRLSAGTYTVTLSGHTGGRSSQVHSVSYTMPDASTLFPAMTLPPARSDITISDSVTNDQSVATADLANPLAVANGPYSISWVSDVVSPSNVRWQILFQQLDINDQPDKHLEARTTRMSVNSADLFFDSFTNTWTWDPGVQQAQIEPGTVVRVTLRVTDSSNTYRAHAQPFYLTRN